MANRKKDDSSKEKASRIAARAIARAAASSAQATDTTPWHELVVRLGQALQAMEEDEYLIVDIRGTNLYVQFAAQGVLGLRAEATSAYYLPEDASISDSQHRALLRLGWGAPTNLPEGIGPHEFEGSPNYFVELEPPVDHGWMAALAVATLASVFGAGSPDRLEYRAFLDDGTPIRFTDLGIEEAAPD